MGVVEGEPSQGGATSTQLRSVRKVVIFFVADQAYGIPLDAVLEILPMATLSRPPGLPGVVAGFLNLEGVAIPVVCLARLFGLAEGERGLYTPLVIMRSGEQTLALLVDTVQEIITVDESATLRLRENFCFNACALGLATVGETNVVLLSCERLLSEQELRRINELTAIERSRLSSFQEEPS